MLDTSPVRNKMISFHGGRNRNIAFAPSGKRRACPLWARDCTIRCPRGDHPFDLECAIQSSDAAALRLSPAAVDVWRVHMTAVDPRPLLDVLSAEERERAARLFDDTRRARFIRTRAALRHILSAYVGGEPAALDLRYGAAGKPYLVRDGAAAALRFSVSHADDLALLAFAWNAEIGVDVERVRPPRHGTRIADRLFDEETRRLLARLPPAERTFAFHHAWTQREAYVKAVGGTLFGTLDPLSLRWPRPGRDVRHVAGGDLWTIAPLLPADGYIGTIVVAGEADRITEREHDPVA